MNTETAPTRTKEPAGEGRSADPRPARTRAAILAAVERLTGVAADQVTVAAIARDAGVSRSAFYTQFSGLEELLSVLLTEAAQRIGPEALTPGASKGFGSRRSMVRTSLFRLVAHVDARATFYTAALGWKMSWGVHDAAQTAYAEQVRRLISAVRESAPADPPLPPSAATDQAATFVAGGLLTAVTAWLRAGRATPRETLVDQLLELLPGWLTSDETTTVRPQISLAVDGLDHRAGLPGTRNDRYGSRGVATCTVPQHSPQMERIMPPLGIIGSGSIGSAVARLAVAAGMNVVIANSRGPETLDDLVAELGPLASAGTVEEAAMAGDVVVLSVPLSAVKEIPVERLRGMLVLDTSNYYPSRDGRIAELDDGSMTTGELVHGWLGEVHYVKAFSNILAHHIPLLARPADALDRSALPIASDDAEAKREAAEIIEQLGFDTVDAGTLSDSWRFEPESAGYTRIYLTDPNTADDELLSSTPGPTSADKVSAALNSATRVKVADRTF
jgi:8-hydroxy-5-deazaflavin:NADPH oxidoreductase